MRAPVLTFKRARRLRRQMTLPEVILWECLRKGRLNGLSFRRQHPLGPYILDFYQPAAKLAVEIDGDAHGDAAQAAHDARRDAWLRGQGIRVLRIPAKDVLDDELREGALAAIAVASVPASRNPLGRSTLETRCVSSAARTASHPSTAFGGPFAPQNTFAFCLLRRAALTPRKRGRITRRTGIGFHSKTFPRRIRLSHSRLSREISRSAPYGYQLGRQLETGQSL